MYCVAIDVTRRYKEVPNQMCFAMYLFQWYSEKSLVAELIFGMVADYMKQKLHHKYSMVKFSASEYKIIYHVC